MDAQTYISLNSAEKLDYMDAATIDELNTMAASIRKIAKAIDMNTAETFLVNKKENNNLAGMANMLVARTYSK